MTRIRKSNISESTLSEINIFSLLESRRVEVQTQMNEIKDTISELQKEMRTDITNLREDQHKIKEELKADIKKEITEQTASLTKMMGGFGNRLTKLERWAFAMFVLAIVLWGIVDGGLAAFKHFLLQ